MRLQEKSQTWDNTHLSVKNNPLLSCVGNKLPQNLVPLTERDHIWWGNAESHVKVPSHHQKRMFCLHLLSRTSSPTASFLLCSVNILPNVSCRVSQKSGFGRTRGRVNELSESLTVKNRDHVTDVFQEDLETSQPDDWNVHLQCQFLHRLWERLILACGIWIHRCANLCWYDWRSAVYDEHACLHVDTHTCVCVLLCVCVLIWCTLEKMKYYSYPLSQQHHNKHFKRTNR